MNRIKIYFLLYIVFSISLFSCRDGDLHQQVGIEKNAHLRSKQETLTDCSTEGVNQFFDKYKHSDDSPYKIFLWNAGIIYYEFDNRMGESQKDTIRMAMAEWENKTGGAVSFLPVEPNTPEKFKVVFSNYRPWDNTLVRNDPLTQLGIQYWGKEGISHSLLDRRADYITTLHELGHVIGLRHEHQRPDRNDYLVFPRTTFNILHAAYKEELEDLKKNMYIDDAYIGDKRTGNVMDKIYDPLPYDYTSIMHYSSSMYGVTLPSDKEKQANNYDYGITSQQDAFAMELAKEKGLFYYLKPNCEFIPEPSSISEKDIALVKWLYPYEIQIFNSTRCTYRVKVSFYNDDHIYYTLSPGSKIPIIIQKQTPTQIDGSYKAVLANNPNKQEAISYVSLNNEATSDDVRFDYNSDNTIDVYYKAGFSSWLYLITGINKPYSKPEVIQKLIDDNITDIDGESCKAYVAATSYGNIMVIVIGNVDRNDQEIRAEFRRSIKDNTPIAEIE